MNEIKYLSVKTQSPIDTHALNQVYGKKGWDLVTILAIEGGFEYVFKQSTSIMTIENRMLQSLKEKGIG